MTESEDFKTWIRIALITLIWHFLLLMAPWHLISLPEAPAPKTPTRIQTISPKKLDLLRQSWKKKEALLLNPHQNTTQKIPTPDYARYFSNQNQIVDRETRARRSAPMPIPGAIQPSTSKKQTQESSSGGSAEDLLYDVSPPAVTRSDSRFSSFFKTNRTTPHLDSQAHQKAQPKNAPATTLGIDQSLIDPELPEGERNVLNTKESIHYSFYSRVYQAIVPVWSDLIRNTQVGRPLIPRTYLAKARVILDSNGKVSRIDFLQPSGVPEFDEAFEAAWKKIHHFPNPPTELIENGVLEMGWTVAVTVRHPGEFSGR